VPPLATPLPIAFLQCFGDKSFGTALWMGAMIYQAYTVSQKRPTLSLIIRSPVRYVPEYVFVQNFLRFGKISIYGNLWNYWIRKTRFTFFSSTLWPPSSFSKWRLFSSWNPDISQLQFPKMYSFPNLQKFWTKIHKELDYHLFAKNWSMFTILSPAHFVNNLQ